MQEKVQGFIIKIVNHNDNSKIITLYTNILGKITVAANIPEKISNGNVGTFDLGNAVEVLLYRKTEDEMYKISEISLIKQYQNIRFSYEKLCILNYVLYAFNNNIEEFYGDRALMNFLKLYMKLLDEKNVSLNKMIFLFDFYFLLINGQIEEFVGLNEIEATLVSELSNQIVLREEIVEYISDSLIYKMNCMKKNKIKILDIKNNLSYN